jgi:hypothetical protein
LLYSVGSGYEEVSDKGILSVVYGENGRELKVREIGERY